MSCRRSVLQMYFYPCANAAERLGNISAAGKALCRRANVYGRIPFSEPGALAAAVVVNAAAVVIVAVIIAAAATAVISEHAKKREDDDPPPVVAASAIIFAAASASVIAEDDYEDDDPPPVVTKAVTHFFFPPCFDEQWRRCLRYNTQAVQNGLPNGDDISAQGFKKRYICRSRTFIIVKQAKLV